MKTFLFLLLTFSSSLCAGLFDWFWGGVEKAETFDCPYGCGTWGSPSIQTIEWDFTLLLYHVDFLTNSSYRSSAGMDDWLNRYPPPKDFNSRWYKDMDYFAKDPDEIPWWDPPLCIENGDCLGYHSDRSNESEAFWGIRHLDRLDKTHVGKIFMRQQCIWFYDGVGLQCDEVLSYKFGNYIDFFQACHDIKDDVDWFYFQGYQYEELLNTLLNWLHNEKMEEYYKEFCSQLCFVEEKYEATFLECAKQHNSPSAHYQNAIHQIRKADWMRAIASLEKLYDRYDIESLEPHLASEICLSRGKIEAEVGFYDRAILSLGQSIKADPSNKIAYFERAITHFEKGDFTKAKHDFQRADRKVIPLESLQESPIKQYSLQDLFQFSSGMIEGIKMSGLQSLKNFIPSTLASVRALANGLWAFAISPKQVSMEMIRAATSIITYLSSGFMDLKFSWI